MEITPSRSPCNTTVRTNKHTQLRTLTNYSLLSSTGYSSHAQCKSQRDASGRGNLSHQPSHIFLDDVVVLKLQIIPESHSQLTLQVNPVVDFVLPRTICQEVRGKATGYCHLTHFFTQVPLESKANLALSQDKRQVVIAFKTWLARPRPRRRRRLCGRRHSSPNSKQRSPYLSLLLR